MVLMNVNPMLLTAHC